MVFAETAEKRLLPSGRRTTFKNGHVFDTLQVFVSVMVQYVAFMAGVGSRANFGGIPTILQ